MPSLAQLRIDLRPSERRASQQTRIVADRPRPFVHLPRVEDPRRIWTVELERICDVARRIRSVDDHQRTDVVVRDLARIVERRDPQTVGHCERLASYACAVGSYLDLPAEDLVALLHGGYLHDVGKVAIPDAILLKAGQLTREEFNLMKSHAAIGDRLCRDVLALRRVRPIIRHHHERLDGYGYPDGFRGDRIPLLAQIMSIVDVYDAITTRRPYKPALAPEVAYEELTREARKGWRRKDLVEAFIATVPEITQPPTAQEARAETSFLGIAGQIGPLARAVDGCSPCRLDTRN